MRIGQERMYCSLMPEVLVRNKQRSYLIFVLLVLLGIPLFLTGCLSRFVATAEPITEADLVGVWQAKYEDIQAYDSRIEEFVDVTGIEILTLRFDGTYQQVYDDGQGNIKTIDGNRWYLDETNIIHLVGGMWPQLGPELSAFFMERNLGGVQPFRGKDLPLDAGEAYVPVSSLGGGRIDMHHLPTGDPDSAEMVWFYRVEDSSQ